MVAPEGTVQVLLMPVVAAIVYVMPVALLDTVAGPFMAGAVGTEPTLIVTVLVLDGQTLLEIVHSNTLAPWLKPLTEVAAEEVLAKEPAPLSTDQLPVPTDGVLAERVAVLTVMFCVVPALEVLGGALTVTAIADR